MYTITEFRLSAVCWSIAKLQQGVDPKLINGDDGGLGAEVAFNIRSTIGTVW